MVVNMKFYLFNGSPRKKYNTAKLLDSASLAITDEYKATTTRRTGSRTNRLI